MIIGSDAHYLKKEDRYVHKAYLNSQDGQREVDDFYEYAYLQDNDDIFKNLLKSEYSIDFINQMISNSYEIYNKIENYSLLRNQEIPTAAIPIGYQFEGLPQDKFCKYSTLSNLEISEDKYDRYWLSECLKGLKRKKLDDKEEYWERLEEEARVKKNVGNALGTNMLSYPTTLQHYIDMFWECGSMVGAGRGSSCAALNHYLLDVTQLDPIKWDLPFFRYLNDERQEIGDIDLDLCPSKRPLIIQKIKEERKEYFNESVDELSKNNLGCTLIATFGTESTKSAILSACRGYRSPDYPDGIDVDIAQYLSSLIEQERGFLFTLNDTIYGNKEKGRKPNKIFINEVNQYPGLLDIMFGIEGLKKQRSSHASGVIMFEGDPYEKCCFMRTTSGEIITQFDLHMAEAAGNTKFDFLVTDVQDKLVQCIELLQQDGQIEADLSLREVYNKYFHPDILDIDNPQIWENLKNGSIINVFQFDSPVGGQAAKKIAPKDIRELSDANGLMRLMTSEKGEETPMDKYVRFKNDISLWYDEMNNFGLTKEEQKVLEPYFLSSYGVPPSQEQMMLMLMDENICGFGLGEANSARKIVGKKLMDKIPELEQKVLDTASSKKLGEYVWKYGIGTQMGYSFSLIHALAYSFIGAQTLAIATKWNPIYWNTACLIVNSGAIDPDAKSATDYAKIAKAIGDILSAGINISLANINKSDFGFKPDVKNNSILFGLKGIINVGDNVISEIIEKRPFKNFDDYLNRMFSADKRANIMLIKAGAFDEFGDRKFIMAKYIWGTCDKKKRLTLQNMPSLINRGLIPEHLDLERQIYNFNKYLKAYCKDGLNFNLNDVAMSFFTKHFDFDLLDETLINQKSWDKIYQKKMDPVREWLKSDTKNILFNLNRETFKADWNKYALGNLSAWEMESLCFYYHDHELKNLNMSKYGIENFFSLDIEPDIKTTFQKGSAIIPIYNIHKICGTCIAKDKAKSTVSLLTTTGVVTVKFRKDYFSLFDKQISQKQEDGKKKIVEKSWFNKGNMIIIQGIRRGDNFIAKKYNSTIGHQLYKIEKIDENGDIEIIDKRKQGDLIDEID